VKEDKEHNGLLAVATENDYKSGQQRVNLPPSFLLQPIMPSMKS